MEQFVAASPSAGPSQAGAVSGVVSVWVRVASWGPDPGAEQDPAPHDGRSYRYEATTDRVECAADTDVSKPDAVTETAGGLLRNGTFQHGLAGWGRFHNPNGTTYYAQYARADAHSDTGYLEANTTVGGGGASVYTDAAVATVVGEEYEATVWVKSASGTVAGNLTLWALGGTTESKGTAFAADGTWRPVTVRLPIANGGHTSLRVQVYLNTGGVNLRVDSASLHLDLLPNGSFDANIAGWSKFNPSGGTTTISHVTGGAQSGTGKLRVVVSGGSGAGSVVDDVLHTAVVGQEYELSLWVRNASATPVAATARITAYSTGVDESASVSFTATSTWQQHKVRLTPSQVDLAWLRAEVFTHTRDAGLEIDTVSMRAVNPYPDEVLRYDCNGSLMSRSTMLDGAGERSLYAWDEFNRLKAVVSGVAVTWDSAVNATIEHATGDLVGGSGLDGSQWAGGAVSQQVLSGDGAVSFRFPKNAHTGRMIGLNTSSSSTSFAEIDFAVYHTWLDTIRVYEHGTQRCAGSVCEFFTDVDDTDVFTIQRQGGTVRYLRNGRVFYTSGVAASGSYKVDTSLLYAGSRVGDVIISAGGSGFERYVYTPDGQRFLRVDPDGTKTVYVGSTELRWAPGGGAVKVARNYPGGTRRNFNGGVSYQVANHQGSITATVNAATGALVNHHYRPYGEIRRGVGSDDHGFLGEVHDNGGLVYLNNRYHDPQLGSFISVDPLVTTTWQPYTYANSNPATLSDPTGLLPWDGAFTWLFDVFFGSLVHAEIEQRYMGQYSDTYAEVSIVNPRTRKSEARIDLARILSGQVGLNEIRPVSQEASAAGTLREQERLLNEGPRKLSYAEWSGEEARWVPVRDGRSFEAVFTTAFGVPVTAWRGDPGVLLYSYGSGGKAPGLRELIDAFMKAYTVVRLTREQQGRPPSGSPPGGSSAPPRIDSGILVGAVGVGVGLALAGALGGGAPRPRNA